MKKANKKELQHALLQTMIILAGNRTSSHKRETQSYRKRL